MSDTRGPGVRWPPPVVVAAMVVGAWALGQVLWIPLGSSVSLLGTPIILGAVALIGWALLTMTRAGNDPRPDRPDAVLIERGPFRYTRNPIYLGFVLIVLGLALHAGHLWAWLAVPAAWFWLDRRVIAREEAYLSARFGLPYDGYRSRTRRWI